MKRVFVIFFFLTLLVFGVKAQGNSTKAPFYVEGSFQLPSPLANRSFRTLMDGVSDVNLSFHVPIYKKLHTGIVLNHSFISFNDVAIPEKTNGRLQMMGVLLNLGVHLPTSERFSIDFSVNTGYEFLLYGSETCSNTQVQQGLIIKPTIGAYIKSSDYLSFGLVLSYTYVNDDFGPERFCLTEFSGYQSSDYQGANQLFGVGFGFRAEIPRR